MTREEKIAAIIEERKPSEEQLVRLNSFDDNQINIIYNAIFSDPIPLSTKNKEWTLKIADRWASGSTKR